VTSKLRTKAAAAARLNAAVWPLETTQNPPPNLSAQSLVPVNELPMNFASQRVDHGYLKVLIIGKATIVKALSEDSAMCNRFFICVKLDPNPVSHWNAVYHVKEKFLHSRQPWFVLFASQFLFLNNARSDTAICRC
jgi:hypothetical protein